MPDLNNKAAMEEIKLVLKKHDLAGVVFVGSKTHTDFLFELCPSWTCTSMDVKGLLRVRAKGKDPAVVESLRLTVSTFAGFSDAMRATEKNFAAILAEIGKSAEFSHFSRLEQPPPT